MEVREILERLDMPRFFLGEGLQPKRQGPSEWVCKCPFCDDTSKDPHFNLNITNGTWICFKCGAHGNAVGFYMKRHGATKGQAIKAIQEFAGIPDDPQAAPASKVPKQGQAQGKKRRRALVPVTAVPEPEKEAGEVAATSEEEPGDTDSGSGGTDNAANIYQLLVDKLTLTGADREALKAKRGFSDATIDEFMFRSGGQEVIAAINEVAAMAGTPALVKAGILVEVNGTLVVNDQLLDNRILIPYLDETGRVYHLRPHKLGFKVPLQAYCRKLLVSKPHHIIITEGEFKAVALHQWGFPALAVPGVSSFAAKNLDRLTGLLRQSGVKSVTVIFDNEDKGNPAYPDYFKPHAEDRFDTPTWSYILAYKLAKEGFTSTVGWLPDEWRQNGKADFDGALAQGHTAKEIQAVIDAAIPPADFVDNLPPEAQRVVRRKIARHFAPKRVRREFNRYVAARRANNNEWEEPISNFVITIKSRFYTADGVIRNVELTNEFGETSNAFALSPGDMAGLNEFKKFCLGRGDYIFKGRSEDLIEIWSLETLRDGGEIVYQPDRIGRINKDLWLFGNLAIHKGEIYRPDQDGVIWIDGKGYKPQSLQIDTTGAAVDNTIPSLSEKPVDIRTVAERLKNAVGGYEAYMGIGWVIATIFSEDIFKAYKCVPILFPHGAKGSGKTTFVRWLFNFFGNESEGVGIAETSQNFIARALSYYSSLGAWFDEYRNEQAVTNKNGYFRSAYNRQLAGKGTATAFQTRGFSVHAAITISGEHTPADSGLFSRLIPLQFSAYKRSREHFAWLNAHAFEFSGFTLWLIQHYDELKPVILRKIAALKEALLKYDLTDRAAENWAICAGAFEAAAFEDREFIKWVVQACQEAKQEAEEEQVLNVFWEDVLTLMGDHKVQRGEHVFTVYQGSGQERQTTLEICFHQLYSAWAVFYRQRTGREPIDATTLRNYLKDEPYFLGAGVSRWGKVSKRVLRIDAAPAPEAVKELVELADFGE